jgi:flagellar biogenesis protein FliO
VLLVPEDMEPPASRNGAQEKPMLLADTGAAAVDVVVPRAATAASGAPSQRGWLRSVDPGILLAGLAALALLVLALRTRPSGRPFSVLSNKGVNLIETISVAPGRSIVLVELRGSALVLGVTPHSINLLDKVPLELLEENYQPTVQEIIYREGAERADWTARPKVAAMAGAGAAGPSSMPLYPRHGGRGPVQSMSVSELRRRRSSGPRLGEVKVTPRAEVLPPLE